MSKDEVVYCLECKHCEVIPVGVDDYMLACKSKKLCNVEVDYETPLPKALRPGFEAKEYLLNTK